MKLPELHVGVWLYVCNEGSSFLLTWIPLLQRPTSDVVMATAWKCTNIYQIPNTAATQTTF
jgi:hypothetical protein